MFTSDFADLTDDEKALLNLNYIVMLGRVGVGLKVICNDGVTRTAPKRGSFNVTDDSDVNASLRKLEVIVRGQPHLASTAVEKYVGDVGKHLHVNEANLTDEEKDFVAYFDKGYSKNKTSASVASDAELFEDDDNEDW